jgi:8-oxo-dGTP diphosphatase
MNVLAEIKEQDINPDAPTLDASGFHRRHAVRAVLLDANDRVALLYVSKRGYHKLPGGGVDEGENLADALDREVMEEVGSKIRVIGEVGRIVEYWDEDEQIQTSDCYLARQDGDQGDSDFTAEEQEHGFEVVWADNIDAAIALLEADESKTYDASHIKPRDLLFLKTAKQRYDSL